MRLFSQGITNSRELTAPRLVKPAVSLWRIAVLISIAAGLCAFMFAQSPAQSTPAPAALDASRILPFLEQTLAWYRQTMVDEQIASDPSEVTMVSGNRQLAGQIVRLSFDFARAEADALSSSPASTRVQAQNGGNPQQEALLKAENGADQEVKKAESELNSLQQKLSRVSGRERQTLQTQIVGVQGELDLEKTRRDAIHSMVEFVAGAGGGQTGGLRGQIDALAASVPTIAAAANNPANAKDQNSTNTEAAASESAGIWGLGEEIFGISHKLNTINTAIARSQSLEKASTELRTPLTNRLRTLTRQADDLDKQPEGESSAQNTSNLAQQRQQVDALTAEFKQLAAVTIPLGKQAILFGLYDKSLENWHNEVRGDLTALLARLGTRLAVLAIFIGFLLIAAQVGKRTIDRYIHEPHRRYQFLLLRKIVLWFAVIIIVGVGFASRLEAAVTYAGLLTAGIAVALQNVIVAIVGYFFLIGRYGIRVGDRVQISGVTGEVVDIGLVRIQVMELGGSGADTPTGRVVAFSNSVVFQPTAGIFRQIPGTDFVWHEVSLTLAPESDFKAVRERFLRAVEDVVADYRDEMDRQSRAMQRNLLAVPEDALKPSVHLHLTPSSLEAVIRFAVDAAHAGEIDERVTRELLDAVDQEPRLKLAGSTPAINLRTSATAG